MKESVLQKILVSATILVVGGGAYGAYFVMKEKSPAKTSTTNTTANTPATNGTFTNLSENGRELAVLGNFEGTMEATETKELTIDVLATPSAEFSAIGSFEVFELVSPSEVRITSANAASLGFLYDGGSLGEANVAQYTLQQPETGTWKMRIKAKSAGTGQEYAISVSAWYVEKVSIKTDKQKYTLGEDVQVFAELTGPAGRTDGVTWEIAYAENEGFQERSAKTLMVYDDGQHGDGGANDHLFGAKIPATDLNGIYTVRGKAKFTGGQIEGFTLFEVAASADISLIGTPTFQPQTPRAGETVTFTFTLKNSGQANVDNGNLEMYVGTKLEKKTPFTLKTGATQNFQMTWLAATGTHEISVGASPFSLPEENEVDDNAAKVTVVVQ